MKRTVRNGDEYHFDKGNKISVKKNYKILLLVFLGLLMAYLKHQRFRSYFKTKITVLSFIRVKTGNNHAFLRKNHARAIMGQRVPLWLLQKLNKLFVQPERAPVARKKIQFFADRSNPSISNPFFTKANG